MGDPPLGQKAKFRQADSPWKAISPGAGASLVRYGDTPGNRPDAPVRGKAGSPAWLRLFGAGGNFRTPRKLASGVGGAVAVALVLRCRAREPLRKQYQVEENDYAENTLDWRNLGRSSAVCDYSGFGQVVRNTMVGNIDPYVY